MRSPIFQFTKQKQTAMLRRLGVSKLIRELQQLTIFTQEQIAIVLGIFDGAIASYKNTHIQLFSLALKQIKLLLKDSGNLLQLKLQKHSKDLLTKYLLEVE
ncbi:hypothetical protein I8752_23140 [Nostocaceae cyanobacterium CENA369]|uniref:Uncharacterized protein n=2 Tax=Dendronalium TaxID=2840442 RepID=A0A8J7LFC1_9NOST|nr:hypothetical protein [Dendronalium phyllosphericum CENA369]